MYESHSKSVEYKIAQVDDIITIPKAELNHSLQIQTHAMLYKKNR